MRERTRLRTRRLDVSSDNELDVDEEEECGGEGRWRMTQLNDAAGDVMSTAAGGEDRP